MGMSLYYEAEREQPLTEQEDSICREIVQRYCAQFPFEEKYEDFGTYDIDKATNIIFSGATKLPPGEAKTMFHIANYWLKCLTEITNALADCTWTVTFEEVPLILDKSEGWRFPTDEEYHLRKTK